MRSEALRGGKTKTQRSKFNSLCPNPLCVTISNLESICLILIPTHKGNHTSRCTVSSSDCGQLTIIRINSSALFLLRRWQPPERRMFQSTPRLHREISPTASLREGVRFMPSRYPVSRELSTLNNADATTSCTGRALDHF